MDTKSSSSADAALAELAAASSARACIAPLELLVADAAVDAAAVLDAVTSVHDVLDARLRWGDGAAHADDEVVAARAALLHVLVALSRHRLPAADALELARGGGARGAAAAEDASVVEREE